LPPTFTFVDNSNGNATMAGTATRTGTYHLTIKAASSRESPSFVLTRPFTLTVASPTTSAPSSAP
ncbi:MAG TPA: hypothetical protein VIJ09_03700, partial [Acidimicrobiales bacterium]